MKYLFPAYILVTIFVANIQSFNYSEYIDCYQRPLNIYYRIPYDCNGFYKCYIEGDLLRYAQWNCKPNMIFEEEDNVKSCVAEKDYTERHGQCINKPLPTLSPTTPEPSTKPPTTPEPSTKPPTTPEPSTKPPTTPEPSTKPPTTPEPSTKPPTTPEPSTKPPTTPEPSTKPPTTPEPSTKPPTTPEPSTKPPTTPEPSTKPPTTPEPSTKPPTTPEPSTEQPTTKRPSFDIRDLIRRIIKKIIDNIHHWRRHHHDHDDEWQNYAIESKETKSTLNEPEVLEALAEYKSQELGLLLSDVELNAIIAEESKKPVNYTKLIKCPEDPTPIQYKRNPYDCSKYYLCYKQGDLVRLALWDCPDGQFFDDSVNVDTCLPEKLFLEKYGECKTIPVPDDDDDDDRHQSILDKIKKIIKKIIDHMKKHHRWPPIRSMTDEQD